MNKAPMIARLKVAIDKCQSKLDAPLGETADDLRRLEGAKHAFELCLKAVRDSRDWEG